MLRPTNVIPMKARLFRALGDEGRLAILESLLDGEQRVSDLVDALALSQSSISTHLAGLRSVGVVARRTEGRSAYYGPADPGVADLLRVAETVILAQIMEEYACAQACCQPSEEAIDPEQAD